MIEEKEKIKRHKSGLYVNQLGMVYVPQTKGNKGHITLGTDNGKGYMQIKYKGTHYFVHRIVAEAFIQNTNRLPCVNHKDENRNNNTVSNLEWCSYSYNNNYNDGQKRRAESRRKNERERIA